VVVRDREAPFSLCGEKELRLRRNRRVIARGIIKWRVKQKQEICPGSFIDPNPPSKDKTIQQPAKKNAGFVSFRSV